MASSKLCDPCQLQEKHTEASEWCPDCEESLCTLCSTHHRSSKASRNHHLVKISVISEIQSHVTSEEICPRHDQLHVEYFCSSHDELCCRGCLADKHRACNDVVVVDIACKNSKLSALEDAKTETKHIIEILESVDKEIDKQCSKVNQKSQKIEKEIADAKNEAMTRLEEFEKALLDKLNTKTAEFHREVDTKSKNIKDLMKTSTEKLKQIEFVEKHGTDKQAFYLAHKFKMFLKEVETPLTEVTSINSVSLEFTKSKASSSEVLLGTIFKSDQPIQLTKYSPVKQKQAQFTVERSRLLTSFQISSQFDTNLKLTNILGMVATDDNKLLLCYNASIDEDGGIYVYYQTGQFIKKIEFHYPFDITYIKSTNQYAVTLGSSQSVQFICSKSLERLNTVELACQEEIYGISATETQIYIGTPTKVIVMNIPVHKQSKESNVFENRNSIYYVQTTAKDVYVSWDRGISTIDKSKDFAFSDGEGRKIAVDKHGFVYVAVRSTPSYIQRLTPDLQPDIKIDIDGGKDMWAICFNKDCSKLFCANNGGRSIITISCS